jgi:hypothetical protein
MPKKQYIINDYKSTSCIYNTLHLSIENATVTEFDDKSWQRIGLGRDRAGRLIGNTAGIS